MTSKIGVLGSGMVGTTIGAKLVELGYEVKMGSREVDNDTAAAWARRAGERASSGDYAQAAAFGELVFNCTSGLGTLEALAAAGPAALRGKVLIDVANPLDFSAGGLPVLAIGGHDSLGERVQAALPETRVVKALNTVNASVMVNPHLVAGVHTVFMSGNDAGAKEQVRAILTGWFGWQDVVDLGDITTARGTESYLPFWLRLWGALKKGEFNIHVVR